VLFTEKLQPGKLKGREEYNSIDRIIHIKIGLRTGSPFRDTHHPL